MPLLGIENEIFAIICAYHLFFSYLPTYLVGEKIFGRPKETYLSSL